MAIWVKRGVGQTRIRRTLWRQGEDEEGRQLVTEVPMKLVKLWDPDQVQGAGLQVESGQ